MNAIEEALFHAASDLEDADVRAAFLDRACGSDSALRARMEVLLEADSRGRKFMADDPLGLIPQAKPAPARADTSAADEASGAVVGRYKLLQKIGEGGMGVVYMAEQEEPVRRRVALKIIKLGMDTKLVVARFEAERQALALMDHPNIARVLDGGATETGRPYFVMELVQGVPITEFCDKNHLSTEQRLKLFVPVCQAIQSAHQKGIIHRDLKPTNILVTLNPDGTGFPKVIDFGVAKATSQKLTEKTLFTAYGMIVGTPAYMSPEQAEMSHLDVDTRADVYSLGALLYELLTGTPPFPEQRLRSAGYNEMQRIILEEQPVKPSTRLSTLQGEQRSIVARNRGASELALGRAFPGDLDWIVMKCLEKDRARRYETANGLAHDIERHLRSEPITARPPSRLYEFQKTLRRHWVGFVAVGAVLAVLAIGLVASTFEAVRARRAEQVAQRAQANEATQKAAAQQLLYKSLLDEAQAIRLARRVGYRDQVFALLKQAKALDVPEKNLAELRREALVCLGDFVGLTPLTLNLPTNISTACLAPSGTLAAFFLRDRTIRLCEVSSGKESARFTVTNGICLDFCFNTEGNHFFAICGRPLSQVYGWAPDGEGRWRQTENTPVRDFTTKLLRKGENVFAINISPIDYRPAVRLHRDVVGCDYALEFRPSEPTDNGSHQVRFRLLDPETGSFIPGYEVTNAVPPSGDMSFCVSGDGRLLAVETRDREHPSSSALVNLYDWNTGKRLNQLYRMGDGPLSLSDDGKHLISLSVADSTIYALPGFERIAQFKEPYYGLRAVIFGNTAALPGNSAVNPTHLWNLARGEAIATLSQEAFPVAFTADGDALLTAALFPLARFYQLKTPEKLELPPHAGAVPGIAFSPDGRFFASAGKDGAVRVCDALRGRTLWETNDLPGFGQSSSYTPDGQLLATGISDRDLVWIRDAHTGQRLLELGTGQVGEAMWAGFSPDGRYLATMGNFTNGSKIWRIERADPAETSNSLTAILIKAWAGGNAIEFAPDSRTVAFWEPGGPLFVWDFDRSDQPRRLASGVIVGGFTPDGRQLVAMNHSGDILTLEVATGNRVSAFRADAWDEMSSEWSALSPDGSMLVAASKKQRWGATVNVWDPKNGKLLYSLPARAGAVSGLAWSPDSRCLALGCNNGHIAIWNLDAVNQILAQQGLNP